jgi:hypothetical protein
MILFGAAIPSMSEAPAALGAVSAVVGRIVTP